MFPLRFKALIFIQPACGLSYNPVSPRCVVRWRIDSPMRGRAAHGGGAMVAGLVTASRGWCVAAVAIDTRTALSAVKASVAEKIEEGGLGFFLSAGTEGRRVAARHRCAPLQRCRLVWMIGRMSNHT